MDQKHGIHPGRARQAEPADTGQRGKASRRHPASHNHRESLSMQRTCHADFQKPGTSASAGQSSAINYKPFVRKKIFTTYDITTASNASRALPVLATGSSGCLPQRSRLYLRYRVPFQQPIRSQRYLEAKIQIAKK